MSERVFLLCAGGGVRWGKHLGVRKHLVKVNGEILLDRTLRLVRQHTSANIVIVAFDSDYEREDTERFAPRHGPENYCDTDKFLSSCERWGEVGQTVLLYGDVFFTEPAMATIMSHRDSYRFFGRREGSHFTGCVWRELFALSFAAGERALLRENMLHVRSRLVAGELKRGGGWELYEHMHGVTGDHFTTIDDFTDDFDYPADYERWLRRYNNPVHRVLVPVYGPAIKQWGWRLQRWRGRLKSAAGWR